MTLQTVAVDLGVRSYDIVIGPRALEHSLNQLRSIFGQGTPVIIADRQVWSLHARTIQHALGDIAVIEVASGEASKSFAEFERITEALLELGLGRDGTIIAFGGGVIGDLAGFCAATLKRGCRFVQIPTTLLSQVDSSVGGKTAINCQAGKNLVGAFYQPGLVVIDTDFLATLPDREKRAGYAEIVKYGLIGDANFFSWLEENYTIVLSLESDAISHAIAQSCAHKAKIVAEDELEGSIRALLNLGHTFGHAIEAEAGYGGDILHGEAVAVGMAMAFRYSHALGFCSAEDVEKVVTHLRLAGLATDLKELGKISPTGQKLFGWMQQDKKNEAGKIKLILSRGIGQSFIADTIDPQHLMNFLHSEPGVFSS